MWKWIIIQKNWSEPLGTNDVEVAEQWEVECDVYEVSHIREAERLNEEEDEEEEDEDD